MRTPNVDREWMEFASMVLRGNPNPQMEYLFKMCFVAGMSAAIDSLRKVGSEELGVEVRSAATEISKAHREGVQA